MERYGFDDYGRHPSGYRARGPYRDAPADRGWSRPDFNVSLGAFGGRDRGRFEGGFESGDGHRSRGWGGGDPRVDRTLARDIMTEAPAAVTADTSLREVASWMRRLDVGVMPVVADQESYLLKGVITDRDIVVRAAAEGLDMESETAGACMTPDVATVREGSTVRDVFDVMKRERVRRVPVTDDSGRLVGIIAQADLAVDYAGLQEQRELEVGEVIERISEPARPAPWHGGPGGFGPRHRRGGYGDDFTDRVRHGWSTIKREARDLIDRGVERGYDRGWW